MKFTERLQLALRPTVKRIIYKKLYGGRLTLWQKFVARQYVKLPDCHQLVKEVLLQERSDFDYFPPRPFLSSPNKIELRRIFLLSLVIATVCLTAGCTNVDLYARGGAEEWLPVPVRTSAKTIVYNYKPDLTEIHKHCGLAYRENEKLWACARFITPELCVIYHAQENPPKALREHEEKHCKGFIHVRNERRFSFE